MNAATTTLIFAPPRSEIDPTLSFKKIWKRQRHCLILRMKFLLHICNKMDNYKPKTALLSLALLVALLSAASAYGKERSDTIGFEGTLSTDYTTSVFDVNTITPSFSFKAGTPRLTFYGFTEFHHIEDIVEKHEVFENKVNPIGHTRDGEALNINSRTDYLIGAFFSPKPRHRLAMQFDGYSYFPKSRKEIINTSILLPIDGSIDGTANYTINKTHSDFYNLAATYTMALDSIGGRTLSLRADINRLSGERGVEMVAEYPLMFETVKYSDRDKSKCRNTTIGVNFSSPRLGILRDFSSGVSGFFTNRKSTYILNQQLVSSSQSENMLQADVAASIPLGKFSVFTHLSAQFLNKYDNILGDILEPDFQFLPGISLSFDDEKWSIVASAERKLIRPSLAITDGIARRVNEIMFKTSQIRTHSDRHDNFALSAKWTEHSLTASYVIKHSPIVTDYVAVSKKDFAEVMVNFRRATDLRFQYTYDGYITRWWHLSALAAVTWQRNPGSQNKRIRWHYEFNITNSLSLGRLGTLNITGNYGSEHIEGNILYGNDCSVDLDWSKNLLSNRLTIRAGVHDIFKTDNDNFDMASSIMSYSVRVDNVTRRLWLGATFNFSAGGKPASSRLADITPIHDFDITRF